MALWKKESNKKDALYVNIFTADNYDTEQLLKEYAEMVQYIKKYKATHQWRKSNDFAYEQRQIGNQFFARKKYDIAMVNYNKCLRFAESESENIGFAYANRSACYFNMKMYDKCLIDIELAKNGNYPERLMEKLNKRRRECEELIKNGRSIGDNEPKLSFEPNKDYPALANSVKIETSEHDGYRVIATEKLSVGQTIFVEPYYVGELYAEKSMTCNICLKSNGNLIPCKYCTAAMFCHGKCTNNEIHHFECDVIPFAMLPKLVGLNIRIPLLRSILMAVRIFPTIDDLIDFVEATIANKTFEIPDLNAAKSKYRTFLRSKCFLVRERYIPWVYLLFKTMFCQSKIANIFKTQKYQRFLIHLIMQHVLILGGNLTNNPMTFINEDKHLGNVILSMQFNPLQSLFRHSCQPNVAFILDRGLTMVVVLLPIESGEELNIALNVLEGLPTSYSERRQVLQYYYNIECSCKLCERRLETSPSNDLLFSDPEFKLITLAGLKNNFQLSREETATMLMKCESFLNKFGHLGYSGEIDVIGIAYVTWLHIRSMTLPVDEIKKEIFDWEVPSMELNSDRMRNLFLN